MPPHTPQSVPLEKYRAPDPMQGTEEGAFLPSYETVSFRAGSRPSLAKGIYRSPSPPPAASRPLDADPVPPGFLPTVSYLQLQETSLMEHLGPVVNFKLRLGGSELSLEALPLIRAMAHYEPEGVYDHCRDVGGVRGHGGQCWVHDRLVHVCVQVAFEDDQWRLVSQAPGESGSSGCIYSRGNWRTAEYATVPTVHEPGVIWNELQNVSVNFHDFSVEVRSASDPYLVALELTNGSLDFGWSEVEEDVLGAVLMTLAVVFGFRPCRTVCKACFPRSRKERFPRPPHRNSGSKIAAAAAAAAKWRRDPDPEMVGMRHAHHHDEDAEVGRL